MPPIVVTVVAGAILAAAVGLESKYLIQLPEHPFAHGRGAREGRTGIVIGNAKTWKVEFVVPESVAVTILEHVSHHSFEHYACIAWLSDVAVVRGDVYACPR